MVKNVQSNVVLSSQKWKQFKYLSVVEKDKEMVCSYKEILHSHQNQQTSVPKNNVDKSNTQNVESRKLDTRV